MGRANGIDIIVLELCETVDVTPRYSDIVFIYQAGDELADSVADAWLNHISQE